MRASAEGYNAAWLSGGGALTQISGDSSYTLDLSAAATHTISGTVTDTTTGAPMAGVRMILYRVYEGYIGLDDTMYTDSSGDYSFTYSEGDSLVGANDGTLYVRVYAGGIDNLPFEYSKFYYSLQDNSGVNFDYGASPQYHGYDTFAVYLTCPQQPNNVLHVETNVIVFQLTNSGVHTIDSIQTTHGSWDFVLSPGEYIVFAAPDSGYYSGYYKDSTYAATWGTAETITMTQAVMWKAVSVVLPQDTSIMHQGGSGVPIDGIAKSKSTGEPLADAHLLLYSNVSGPAGATNPVLLHTTVTNEYGDFSFGKIVRHLRHLS